ncbi:MAG: inosine/xanthosine triphosphatase [bacterium]
MIKVLVGSKNPVKIESAKITFEKYFGDCEVLGIDVNSSVPNQPINNDTFEGAKNRALELFKCNSTNNLAADYFVGIEGGIMELYNIWFSFGCMCVIDKNKNIGYGTSPLFQLPKFVVDRLLKGEELGDVIDSLFDKTNTKQNLGAIGYLTNGVMNRTELYSAGLITALIPFVNKKLWLLE